MGDGPLCPAGQGLLQNHIHRFPGFFQMPRDEVVDEPLQRDLPVLRGSRQDGEFPVQDGGNVQRPALHARNSMQVFIAVEGRLYGSVPPGPGRGFPHYPADVLRVHSAGPRPAFHVLSFH